MTARLEVVQSGGAAPTLQQDARSAGPAGRGVGAARSVGAAAAARRPASRPRDARGDRYDLGGARPPGPALPKLPRGRRADALTVAVPDPTPACEGDRVLATVNRRVDILETERANRLITVSQYETGRVVQAVLERASGARLGSGGWGQGGTRDQTEAHELAIVYAIQDAQIIRAMAERITRALGHIDARLLRLVLGEGRTYAEVAALQGKGSGDRAARYIAARFRDALAELDERFAARGVVTGEVRASRAAPSHEPTDAAGRVVPPAQAYRLRDDPAARWQPKSKARAQADAERARGERRR